MVFFLRSPRGGSQAKLSTREKNWLTCLTGRLCETCFHFANTRVFSIRYIGPREMDNFTLNRLTQITLSKLQWNLHGWNVHGNYR